MADETASPTPGAESDVPPAGGPPAEPLVPEDRLDAGVEAVLLSVDKPLPAGRIAEALGLDRAGAAGVKDAVDRLNEAYEREGRSFRVEQVAGGFRVMTLPEFAGAVAAVRGLRESQRLSRPAIETLAIVAYKQPVTRVQVEAIRGVACGEVLRTLLDRRLVAIVGRAEELGRPMLYGTSKRFLEVFGLASTKDLPPVGDVFPGLDAGDVGAEEPEPAPGADAEPSPGATVAEPAAEGTA